MIHNGISTLDEFPDSRLSRNDHTPVDIDQGTQPLALLFHPTETRYKCLSFEDRASSVLSIGPS